SLIPIRYEWQPNRGKGSGLNRGVRIANGDWIAFNDSDDVWYPNKLAVQITFMDTLPHVPFFYSKMDFFSVDPDGTIHWSERKSKPSVLEPLMFHGQPNVRPSTVVMRKELFQQMEGFNPSLRIGEDWELFTRIALKYQLHFIPQSL